MEISRHKLDIILKNICFLDSGGGGETYYDPKINKVIKIFHYYNEPFLYEPYTKEKVMKFNGIVTKTFIFPNDVILVDGIVVGYICDYVKGKTLQKINLLSLNLLEFSNRVKESLPDISIVSDNNIVLYDLLYNIMYGKDGLFIIDTDDYIISHKDNLYKRNISIFNDSIKNFLVDNYFDEFVNANNLLKEMYYDKDCNISYFLDAFYKSLSESIGNEIEFLNEAFPLINKKIYEPNFIRRRNR